MNTITIQSHDGVCGIYKITCIATGRFYIGSSLDMYARIRSHVSHLRRGIHDNEYLQRSWDKYGEESFTFCEHSRVDPCDLERAEFKAIEETKAYKRSVGFNLTRKTDRKLIVSEETRRKLSISGRGRKYTEEQKKRMSESMKGIRSPRSTYTLVDPKGNKVVVNDLVVFCKENKISYACVISMSRGNSKTHKGYRIWNGVESEISIEEYNKRLKPKKTYNTVYFYDKNGKVVMIDHLVSFCKKMNLSYFCMRDLLTSGRKSSGKRIEHRGYSIIHPSLIAKTRFNIASEARSNHTKHRILSPDGSVIHLTNVSKWARDNRMHCRSIWRIIRGERKQYKGYTYIPQESCPENKW